MKSLTIVNIWIRHLLEIAKHQTIQKEETKMIVLFIRGKGKVVCQRKRESCLSEEKGKLFVRGKGKVVYQRKMVCCLPENKVIFVRGKGNVRTETGVYSTIRFMMCLFIVLYSSYQSEWPWLRQLHVTDIRTVICQRKMEFCMSEEKGKLFVRGKGNVVCQRKRNVCQLKGMFVRRKKECLSQGKGMLLVSRKGNVTC